MLTDEDRLQLARMSQGGSPRLAERARIVLACAEPAAGNAGVAVRLGLTTGTVRKWRSRFARAGLDGLADHDRPGRPKAGLALTSAERDQLMRWARQAQLLRPRGGRHHDDLDVLITDRAGTAARPPRVQRGQPLR